MNARGRRAGSSRTLVAALVLSVLLVGTVAAPAPVQGASLKDQIAAARERQANLSNAIAKSQGLVEALKKDEAATRNDLAQTIDELKDIRADHVAVKERIAKVRERLDHIEARHADLVEEQRQTDFTLGLLEQELANGEEDLKARRQALGRRLAEAYRSENTTLLEQVFTADSFSDVLTDASAYLAYGDQDAQLAQQITQDQQALDSLRLLTTSTRLRTDQLRRETVETWDQVLDLRQKLGKARRQLERLERRTEKARDRQEAQIKVIIKNKKQAQAIVRKQQSARNKLMHSIRNKVAALQARANAQFGGVTGGSGSGRFVWPASGSITQGYGCTGYYINPPRGSCSHFHDGIDIANNAGTPIRSADNGIVAFVGWNPYEYSPAYIIVIAHGGGLSTLYAHLQPRSLVSVGQTVKRGQAIGYMGNTGGSFGVHLHFEVWQGDWNSVNPYTYL